MDISRIFNIDESEEHNHGYNVSTPDQLPKLRQLDRFMANHSGYIAGGCFKNLFYSEPIKDIDIFSKTSMTVWKLSNIMKTIRDILKLSNMNGL